MTPFLDIVRSTIEKHRMLKPRDRVLVGVSGGPDSLALLSALVALRDSLRLDLRAAYVDHGLRPADSCREAALVKRMGRLWGVPVDVVRRKVAKRGGESLEAAARSVRYKALVALADRHRCQRIALGHTQDDQAETVLMRMMRGTGLMGLGAMAFSRSLDRLRIVRPLLEVWRRDIRAYAERMRLAVREDATNEDRQFMRNRIRHELLPLLERDYNPNIKRALTQLAEQSQGDYAYLEAAATRQWKRLAKVRPSSAHVAIAIPAFRRQPNALQRQLLRSAIRCVRGDVKRLEFRHWVEAERLFAEQPVGTLLDLPGGVQLRREHGRVICLWSPPASSSPTSV